MLLSLKCGLLKADIGVAGHYFEGIESVYNIILQDGGIGLTEIPEVMHMDCVSYYLSHFDNEKVSVTWIPKCFNAGPKCIRVAIVSSPI